MTEPEEDVLEGLYRRMRADWRRLRELRDAVEEIQDRLRAAAVQAIALGATKRGIARESAIPEPTVRRYANPERVPESEAGAA